MAVRFEYSKIKVFIFNVVELETVSVFSSIKLVYSFRGKNVNTGGKINQSIYLITPDFFSWVDLFYPQLLPLFFIDYLSTSFSHHYQHYWFIFLPGGRLNLLLFPRSKSCQELLKCSFQINKPKWQQHSSHTLGALPCFVSLKEKKTHNSVLRLLSHFSCLTCQVQVSQVLLLISF